MTMPAGTQLSDPELLRAIARARADVLDFGSGGGRLDVLIALEAEMDYRLAMRRARASSAAATFGAAS
jgi:hypothetical protein